MIFFSPPNIAVTLQLNNGRRRKLISESIRFSLPASLAVRRARHKFVLVFLVLGLSSETFEILGEPSGAFAAR